MPQLIRLRHFDDDRGSLAVIEKELGYDIKRVFYIYRALAKRGGHGHHRCRVALIAVHGEVRVTGQTPENDFLFDLRDPSQCLLLDPQDWHEMEFSRDAVLLVLASHEYQADDYFYQKYRT